jgi:glucose dehydrogenase
LIDGVFPQSRTGGGQPRKMLAQAARNGYFVLLDRTNGKHLVTAPFVETLNWAKGVDVQGRPVPDPAKEPKADGTLVSPASTGAANWPAPSFNPDTGMFYLHAMASYSVYYLTDLDDKPEGYGGRDDALWSRHMLQAIEYKTGKIVWSHVYPGLGGGLSGLLSTAGKLLFGGDPTGNVVAFDSATGKILWHAGLAAPVSNAPITFELDGRQYVVVGANDMLYAFSLPQ